MAAAARTARPRFFSIIAPVVIDSRSPRGPIPKLPGTRGTFVCELRNPRTTGNSMISSAPFEPADRDRFYRTMCANFGFGALIGHVANGLQRGADNMPVTAPSGRANTPLGAANRRFLAAWRLARRALQMILDLL